MHAVAEDSATRRPAPARPWLKRRKVRRAIFQACVYAALIALGIVFAMPLLWMLSTSLKSDRQLLVYPPAWIPSPILWSNYPKAWTFAPFNLYLRNTIVITSLALVGQVSSASVVAYGFARLRFPGRDVLFIGVLATMMLPGVVTLIPVFLVYKKLGWVNTFYPLTVPAYFGGGAFFIFLLRQYMRTIPLELSDAARIDGCSELGIFARIVMPLSLPAVATVAIFSFLGHWNDFMGPLIYLNDENKKTMMLGLQSFISQHGQEYQYMMAVALLATLPSLLVFFLFQRVFIQSVVLTGIKG